MRETSLSVTEVFHPFILNPCSLNSECLLRVWNIFLGFKVCFHLVAACVSWPKGPNDLNNKYKISKLSKHKDVQDGGKGLFFFFALRKDFFKKSTDYYMTPTISFDMLKVDCIFTSHWTNCLLGLHLIIFYWSDRKNWKKKSAHGGRESRNRVGQSLKCWSFGDRSPIY